MLLRAEGESHAFGHFEASADSLLTQPLANPGAAITACTLYVDSGGWLSGVVSSASEGDAPSPVATGMAFCAAARASGMLEIFALPIWEQVFYNSGLTQVPRHPPVPAC